MQNIRDAYFRARDEFKTPYPFALDSTHIGLFGPPDEPKKQVIWICVGEDEEGTRKYFQLTGKKHHNQMIGEVVRSYAYRLVFDDTTKLAKKYLAYPTVEEAPESSSSWTPRFGLANRSLNPADIRLEPCMMPTCPREAQHARQKSMG